ncbi:C40 family peptidase [Pararhodobacter zhoushanensis]|uniref:C40 family peptidase n=1 Tax=Pararhodobacter zhoushanensis TaxID=2479545 RepID=A0ABT3H2Y0_9RHOB|nr:C40 family peptidase [Pararhodobacter zhoushanensis]MCW1934126.1 C40 family peptidase [Pararhodobacter zhoushanensis]
MSWSDRFLGIPFADLGRTRAGCDCWGLACVIYRHELRITLPDYLGGYASADEHREIAALIAGETAAPLWQPVTGPAAPFDIAVFRRGRFATHVGVVIRPGLMIHMAGEDQSKVERYAEGPWHSRFAGHFRHASRAVERPVQLISEAPR